MVFSSLIFIFEFLPITLFFHLIAKNIRLKNIILLIASLFFYAWGEPIWIIVLILSTFLNFISSQVIENNKGKRRRRNALIISISVNLAILIIFKYSAFIVENINLISPIKFLVPNIKLPIGISFYTFQTMSYTIDVYKKNTKAQKSFINLLMYVALFPQLIAGPIVRYVDIEKEITYRKVTLESLSNGITRFLIGLSKKVLIANYAGKLVSDLLSTNIQTISVFSMWLGIIFFSLQIYFDFSGYSDMAIGLGDMFGFKFLENFNYPYMANSVTDFWRRWHISLSTFFRDYVYIPLGGNKHNQMRNLFIVWFLTGLWHGASWNFIFWGLYFFLFILFEKFVLLKFLEKIPSIIRHIYTLFVVLFGWILFYFDDLSKLKEALAIMFGLSKHAVFSMNNYIILSNNYIFLIIAVIACLPISKYIKRLLSYLLSKHKFGIYITPITNVVFNLFMMFLCIASLVGSSYNPFLYFRF